MDDGRFLAELAGLPRHAVGEAGADGDDQVGVILRDGGSVLAVHTDHAEVTGVLIGDAGDAHEGTADDRVDLVGEFDDIVIGFCRVDAAADVDERLLRLVDGRDRFGDAVLLGLDAVVGTGRALGLEVRDHVLDVLRDVDEDGARTVRLGDLEGLSHDGRQLVDIVDEVVVLGDGQSDAGDVDLLETVLADHRTTDVAGDGDDRDGVQHGGGDAGDEVRGTGAGGGEHDADFAGRSRIAVCRMGRVLLVGDQYVVDPVRARIERVVDIQDGSARVSEDVGDSLIDEGFNNDFRTFQFHKTLLLTAVSFLAARGYKKISLPKMPSHFRIKETKKI